MLAAFFLMALLVGEALALDADVLELFVDALAAFFVAPIFAGRLACPLRDTPFVLAPPDALMINK